VVLCGCLVRALSLCAVARCVCARAVCCVCVCARFVLCAPRVVRVCVLCAPCIWRAFWVVRARCPLCALCQQPQKQQQQTPWRKVIRSARSLSDSWCVCVLCVFVCVCVW
jgi:hypothetical protein